MKARTYGDKKRRVCVCRSVDKQTEEDDHNIIATLLVKIVVIVSTETLNFEQVRERYGHAVKWESFIVKNIFSPMESYKNEHHKILYIQ